MLTSNGMSLFVSFKLADLTLPWILVRNPDPHLTSSGENSLVVTKSPFVRVPCGSYYSASSQSNSLSPPIPERLLDLEQQNNPYES